MKKLILILIANLCFCFAFAQQPFKEVLYLKDGRILDGEILEDIPTRNIKFKLPDMTVLTLSRSEVDSIRKFEAKEKNSRLPYKEPNSNVAYYFQVESGVGLTTGVNGSSRFILNLKEFFQLNSFMGIGMGAGRRYYFREDAYVFPVFVHYRIEIPSKMVKPFFNFGFGYAVSERNEYFFTVINDPIIITNFGFSYPLSKKIDFCLGFGFEFQKLRNYPKLSYRQFNNSYNPYYGSYNNYGSYDSYRRDMAERTYNNAFTITAGLKF